MAMTQSILQEFGIGHKCHVINTDNGSNIRRAMIDLSLVEVETEAVDINMNTEQEGVANQVVDEFLPEDLADEPLGLPVLVFWMLELEELTLRTRIKRENNSSSSWRMRLKFRHCKTKHFNKMGKFVDVKLEELGAKRVHELGLGDDDANLEDDFITWKEAFWTSVCAEFDIEASSEDFNTRQYEHKVLEEGGYKPEKLYTGEVARLRSYVTQRPPFDVNGPD